MTRPNLLMQKPPLRVWTVKDFKGHWPVGTAAVVVAPDVFTAQKYLNKALEADGLAGSVNEYTLVELDLSKCSALILNNGEY